MPNVYLSQGDLVKLATYESYRWIVGYDEALKILEPRLQEIAKAVEPRQREIGGAA